MTWHRLKLSEDDPHHPNCGFYRIYYATVNVEMDQHFSKWFWCQIDENNTERTFPISKPFNTELEAKDDALKTLGGTEWE